MLYVFLKYLHVACVILSITGFCVRGLLHMRKSALVGRRWLRILPHVNDTLLLAAALGLAALLGQYPFVHDWLTAKVLGLIAYIVLGAIALRPGRPGTVRIASGVAAVCVFGWIVSVAVTRQPPGWLA